MKTLRNSKGLKVLFGAAFSLSIALTLSLTSFAKGFGGNNAGPGGDMNGGQGQKMQQGAEMQTPPDMPNGEMPEGELSEGQLPEGQMPEGQMPEGEFKPEDGENPPEKPEGDISFNDISGDDISFNDVSKNDLSYNEPKKADPIKESVTEIVEESDDDETLITKLVNWVKSLFAKKKSLI